MLKKYLYIYIIFACISCKVNNCFESTGEIIQEEVTIANFTKILVGNEISLVIKQGVEQKVIIKTGENLIDNISVKVVDDKLFLKDENTCNFTRTYGVTKIIVTSPNIVEIRSDTARNISSIGVLEYPNLTLFSEDFFEDTLTNAEFNLTVDNQSLRIVSNGSSIFKISGSTVNLNVGFYAGTSRFVGDNLLANNVVITHKSTNDMLVNPLDKIEGTIFSLGDVISYNLPAIINVEELYKGKLIFY